MGDKYDRFSFEPVTFTDLDSNVTIVYISAGYTHSFAIDSLGRVWATGSNFFGALGLGNNVDQTSFKPVAITGLTPAKIKSIAAGHEDTLILDGNGKIWATGYNWHGGIGVSSSSQPNLFEPITISGFQPTEFVSISTGNEHSIAADSNGNLWVTGNNVCGQLSSDVAMQNSFKPVIIGLVPSKITSVAAGACHSLALDSDGKIWTAGNNIDGQLGVDNSGFQKSFRPVILGSISSAKIVSIVTSSGHSLALDDNNKLWVTGNNFGGQLGLGDKENRFSFEPVTIAGFAPNVTIKSIAAGVQHSLVLTSDGKLWVAGSNMRGQLGLGEVDQSGLLVIERNVFTQVEF